MPNLVASCCLKKTYRLIFALTELVAHLFKANSPGRTRFLSSNSSKIHSTVEQTFAKIAATPVISCIREIDDKAWLIDGKLLLTRATSPESSWGYTIVPAPHPLPESRPLRDDSEDIKLVYDAGEVSAVFSIGDHAFCKVQVLSIPQATREHVTLAWIHERKWSFQIPKTLYHAQFGDRYYHFISRVQGETLDSVWPQLEEAPRQRFVEEIIGICAELAVPAPGDVISGVDGGFVPEEYLTGKERDCCPETLKRNCMSLGMDCASLVFYHCDLGPMNILVDLQTNSMGIIDWEVAGFVPREWIKTKFRVSRGMNLSTGDEMDWRRRVVVRMGGLGYVDVVEAFVNVKM